MFESIDFQRYVCQKFDPDTDYSAYPPPELEGAYQATLVQLLAERQPEFQEQKALPQVGDTVTWKYGSGDAIGEVVKTYSQRTALKLGKSTIVRNGTEENPALKIRQDNKAIVLKLASEVEIVDFVEESEQEQVDFAEVVKESIRSELGSIDFRSLIHQVIKWNGLALGVEYRPGDVRFKGTGHERKLKSGYGHIRKYVGADGEALDCYLSPAFFDGGIPSDRIFEVAQLSPEDGDFDEHKFMIGFVDEESAKSAYLKEMPDSHFGGIKEVAIAELSKYRKQFPGDFAEAVTRYLIEISQKLDAMLLEQQEGQEQEIEDDEQEIVLPHSLTSFSESGFKETEVKRDAKGRFAKKNTAKKDVAKKDTAKKVPDKNKNEDLDALTEKVFREEFNRYKEDGSYKYIIFDNGKKYDDILQEEGEEAAEKAYEDFTREAAKSIAKELRKKAAIESERETIAKSKDKNLKRELKAFDRLYPRYRHQMTLQEFKDKNPDVDLLSQLDAEEKLDKQLSYTALMKGGEKHTRKLDKQMESAQSPGDRLKIMENYRNELIKNGMSLDDAARLAESKKIDDSIEFDFEKERIRETSTEFYQITGGAGSSTLDTFKYDKGRAYTTRWGRAINVGSYVEKSIIFHEMGHHVEFGDYRIAQAAREWRDARATGEEQPLNNLVKFGLYDSSEKAKPGNYITPYVGKVYTDGSTEVISTGLEKFDSGESMLELYERDKEHFQFIVGVIRRG